uniref:Uncharacterized protein n=1 Tax=uncultured marine virus TaxID=186617 RepID=A0A0F7L1N3_9VIRU|nr:hypothetical protein [uncultured marine virus]
MIRAPISSRNSPTKSKWPWPWSRFTRPSTKRRNKWGCGNTRFTAQKQWVRISRHSWRSRLPFWGGLAVPFRAAPRQPAWRRSLRS